MEDSSILRPNSDRKFEPSTLIGFFEVQLMCEAGCVSGDVAFQMRHFPAHHGVKVTPSDLAV